MADDPSNTVCNEGELLKAHEKKKISDLNCLIFRVSFKILRLKFFFPSRKKKKKAKKKLKFFN